MRNSNYYKESLNSLQLVEVYNTKIERIQKFLNNEIEHVKRIITKKDEILEIGAGYGRIIKELAPYAKYICGIDISSKTIEYGRNYLKELSNISLEVMDAYNMNFKEQFDITLCLQNGISAIKGNHNRLVECAVKATRKNGKIIFSTYSPKIWDERVKWFIEQSGKGLIGKLDLEKTKNGIIYCSDGFEAMTFTENDFHKIGKSTGYSYYIEEVDESSVFLVIDKSK